MNPLRWLRSPLLTVVGVAGVAGVATGATIETPRAEVPAAEPVPEPEPLLEPAPASPPIASEPPEEAALEPEPTGEMEPDVVIPSDEPRAKPKWIRHRVVPRETLTQIAMRYGVKISSIKSWNDLGPDHIIKPRDRLKIFARKFPPKRELVDRVVVTGDTWGSIARAYGVSPNDLRAYNVRRTGRRLDEGEKVYIWIDPTIYEHIEGYEAEPGPAQDVYPGGFSVGTPNEGRLVNAAKLPPSDDYTLRYPNSAWGTTHAVQQVIFALRDFRERTDFPGEIRIGSMSRQRGGDMGGHKSHQSGRDIDIRLPVIAGTPNGVRPKRRNIDWEATWHLINAFVDTGEVQIIFLDYKRQRHLYNAAREMGVSEEELDRVLQYPIGKLASRGKVRHSHGHDGHIHVRFRCGDFETECSD